MSVPEHKEFEKQGRKTTLFKRTILLDLLFFFEVLPWAEDSGTC